MGEGNYITLRGGIWGLSDGNDRILSNYQPVEPSAALKWDRIGRCLEFYGTSDCSRRERRHGTNILQCGPIFIEYGMGNT